MKIINENRKARHDYFLFDTYEAGLALTGTEIKSVRKGSAQLKDAYISIRDGEAWIKQMHIAPYDSGNRFNHDELRDRKLLLHKQEIRKLAKQVQQQGYTVVPTKLYLKDGRAKLEIALAKGKHLYDKRQDAKKRDDQRAIERVMKRHQ